MLKFTKKNLYKDESKKFEKFLKKRLETNTEYNERIESEDDDYGMDMYDSDDDDDFSNHNFEDVLDGNGIDFSGGFNDDFGGYGVNDYGLGNYNGNAVDDDGLSEIENDNTWEQNNRGIVLFLKSLPHALLKSVRHFVVAPPKKDEWVEILPTLTKVNAIVILVSIVYLVLGVKIPLINPVWQIGLNSASLVISQAILRFVLKENYYDLEDNKLVLKKKEDGNSSEDDSENNENDEFNSESDGLDGFGELGHNLDTSDTEMGEFNIDIPDHDMDFDKSIDFEEGMDDFYGEGMDDDYEDDSYEGDDSESNNKNSSLAKSPIVAKGSDEEYKSSLLEVYKRNAIYTGRDLFDREELVKSFSGYFITGDERFGEYTKLKERSNEYNNVSYAVFSAICSAYDKFNKIPQAKDGEKPNPDDYLFTVMSIKKSPLIYIIDLRLPNYINLKGLKAKIDLVEGAFKSSASDLDVSVLIESYGNKIVFKLLRLDNKSSVTIGDILRFDGAKSVKGETSMEMFTDRDKGMPMLLGLMNNETPLVIDYEANTSGVIVGGSGSGKSWNTFSWMYQFVTNVSYLELNFIIMDAKNSNFWQQFSKMPHVLGMHTNIYSFLDILGEVEKERQRRQELLLSEGFEDYRGWRKSIKKRIREGDIKALEELKRATLLNVIIDEITYTMSTLKTEDADMHDALKGILTSISSTGRSAGVRLLLIGQRAIDTSIAKGYMANSSLKFGMKMDTPSDFATMFGDDIKKEKKPEQIGMGIIKSADILGKNPMIKTLTLGATSDEHMIDLIRVLAFDWLRRAKGVSDLTKQPEGMSFSSEVFNRPEIYANSKNDMKRGRILAKERDITPELAIDLNDVDNNSTTSYNENNNLNNDFERSSNLNKESKNLDDLFENSNEDSNDYDEDYEDSNDYIEDNTDNFYEDINDYDEDYEDLYDKISDSNKKEDLGDNKQEVVYLMEEMNKMNKMNKMNSTTSSKKDNHKKVDKEISDREKQLEEKDRELEKLKNMLLSKDEEIKELKSKPKNKKVKVKEENKPVKKVKKSSSKKTESVVKKEKNTLSNKDLTQKSLSVEKYIIENGKKEDDFTYYIAKDELEKVYPMNKINKALKMIAIVEDDELGRYYTDI